MLHLRITGEKKITENKIPNFDEKFHIMLSSLKTFFVYATNFSNNLSLKAFFVAMLDLDQPVITNTLLSSLTTKGAPAKEGGLSILVCQRLR